MESKDIFNSEALKRHNKFVAKNKRNERFVKETKGSPWVYISDEEFRKLEKEKNR